MILHIACIRVYTMKQNITADQMKRTRIDDFRIYLKSFKVHLSHNGEQRCKAVRDTDKWSEGMTEHNYSELKRSVEKCTEGLTDNNAIRIMTNRHHQTVCYLIK